MTVWNLTICRHSDGGKLTFADRIPFKLLCLPSLRVRRYYSLCQQPPVPHLVGCNVICESDQTVACGFFSLSF